METIKKFFPKNMLWLPAVLVGIVVLVVLVKTKSVPEPTATQERVWNVRVFPVPAVSLIPKAVVYGIVKPGTVWNAIPEVSGKIIEKNPDLKQGAFIPKDEVLIKIDPTPYELQIRQRNADLRNLEAQLKELNINEENRKISLKIEQRSQELAEKDLTRLQSLAKKGVNNQQQVDQQERSTLAQRQVVQNLVNTLSTIPTQRELLQARIDASQAQLESAERDLKHTVMRMPFPGRIATVKAELFQFVAQGQSIATIDSIDIAEIEAQLPIEKGRFLIPPQQITNQALMAQDALEQNSTQTLMAQDALEQKSTISPQRAGPQEFGWTVTVSTKNGNALTSWTGRVVRASDALDAQARTLGLIVAVDNPYKPNGGPPLFKNAFVEVTILGKVRPDSLVIPRSALHGDTVYVMNQEQRLEIRKVRFVIAPDDLVIVEEGLTAGEIIVASALGYGVEGMKLNPVEDTELLTNLIAQAEGK
ncbi:MAG: hypothetical protein HQM11_17855 [SAR324 cluster bacterium]|nr:hypothetical protein [SAR324 cluster bacterium]